jgi:hypothetical protein
MNKLFEDLIKTLVALGSAPGFKVYSTADEMTTRLNFVDSWAGKQLGVMLNSAELGADPGRLRLSIFMATASPFVFGSKVDMPWTPMTLDEFKALSVPEGYDKLKQRVLEVLANVGKACAEPEAEQRPEDSALEEKRASDVVDQAVASEQGAQEAQVASTPPEAAPSEQAAEAQNPDEYRNYRIPRDNLPDLVFCGKQLALVASDIRHNRALRLGVFQTQGGSYIGLREGVSLWPGEHTKRTVAVAKSVEELVAFFGYDPLAKALYKRLNADLVERID